MCCLLLQSCLTPCDPVDCSPPGSSVHEILQAWIVRWVIMPSSRGSSWPRDQIQVSCVSCIAGGFLTHWAMWEAPVHLCHSRKSHQNVSSKECQDQNHLEGNSNDRAKGKSWHCWLHSLHSPRDTLTRLELSKHSNCSTFRLIQCICWWVLWWANVSNGEIQERNTL